MPACVAQFSAVLGFAGNINVYDIRKEVRQCGYRGLGFLEFTALTFSCENTGHAEQVNEFCLSRQFSSYVDVLAVRRPSLLRLQRYRYVLQS